MFTIETRLSMIEINKVETAPWIDSVVRLDWNSADPLQNKDDYPCRIIHISMDIDNALRSKTDACRFMDI